MNEIYNFLKELKKNNNREWFNANKERYLKVKATVDAFTQQLINATATINPEAARLTPSDCTYRIYRDTRFSPDKTPYKTHIGIFICPGGNKKSDRCGYYIHLEPGNSFVGGGCWCPPAPLLKEIRQSIYDNIDEYLEIINAPVFRERYKSREQSSKDCSQRIPQRLGIYRSSETARLHGDGSCAGFFHEITRCCGEYSLVHENTEAIQ